VTTEIEKLERRWQENPLGLTFAPLAEAYRKTGSVSRALELLDTGLAQHPGYVPAHIVRGRCHLDSGERALAELDFLCVAELDPENVIALKALADLAEEEGRTSDAIRRLESLLEIDRNNDEAAVQLERLRSEQLPSKSSVDSSAEFMPRDDASSLQPSDQRIEGIVLHDDRHMPQVLEPEASAMVEPVMELAEVKIVEFGDVVEEVPVKASEPEPVPEPGLETRGLADLPDELTEWLADPMPEPVAQPETALPAEPVAMQAPDSVAVPEPIAEPEPKPASEPEPQPEPEPALATGVAADEGFVIFPEAAEADSEIEAVPESMRDELSSELMVTETMAEIFLRQGHRELALAVYHQLLQREPGNERIAAAAGELSASLAPQPPVAEAPAPPPPPRFDAQSTGGRSVKELFSTVLSAGRPRPAAAVHPPAFDREENKAPSFDEFFATEEPAAPASAASVPEPMVEAQREHLRTGDVEELEQFHAWLRGLKT
jgi:tetratricopeptide (TPR) repeat protein